MTGVGTRPSKAKEVAAGWRGISLPYWFWNGPDDPGDVERTIRPADLLFLRSLGFNVVRIPIDLYPLLDTGRPDTPRADRLALVEWGIERALAADLAVLVDLHNAVPDKEGTGFGTRLERDDAFVDAFLAFWQGFAARLAHVDPARLLLELLNEPVFDVDPGRWNTLLPRVVAAARAGAPAHTFIVAGTGWGSLDGLLALDPVADDNVLYNFHYYEPFVFTHQGADWTWDAVRSLHDVPYPLDPDGVGSLVDAYDSRDTGDALGDPGEGRWDAVRIGLELDRAVSWAQLHGVRLICTEFGVYQRVAPTDARARWLTDVRTALEARRIPWLMWAYDTDFGLWTLDQDGQPLGLDAEVVAALGLRDPRPGPLQPGKRGPGFSPFAP
jgi:endoglucanase